MREDVSLQVVGFYQGDAQSHGHAFGKRHADEERAHQSGAERHGDGREIALLDIGLFERLVNDRHDVLLVGTRGQFGHNASVGLMDGLAGRHVAEQHAVLHDSGRGVVAAGLYG